MTVMNDYKVFISHSSADKEVAAKVCGFLEYNGIKCWIAPRDIEAGASYPNEITRGIKECEVFLVLLSADSIKSSHVNSETDIAFNAGKKLIPLFIENVKLDDSMSYYLARKQWVFAYPDIDRALSELLHSLKADENKTTETTVDVKSTVRPPVMSPPPLKKNADNQNVFSLMIRNKGCLITVSIMCGILFVFVPMISFLMSEKNVSNPLPEDEELPELYGRVPMDTDIAMADTVVVIEDPEKGREGCFFGLMEGEIAGKDALLRLSIENKYSRTLVTAAIEIGNQKFESSGNYLNKKSLTLDLENQDGEFEGSLDGVIYIVGGIIVYKGESRSQNKSPELKEGQFRFSKIISAEEMHYLRDNGIQDK